MILVAKKYAECYNGVVVTKNSNKTYGKSKEWTTMKVKQKGILSLLLTVVVIAVTAFVAVCGIG